VRAAVLRGRRRWVNGDNGAMYCVCREHIEKALDRFVDEYEDAPDLVDLKETAFADWQPPKTCDFCGEAAAVLVV